jgi:flagellar protein FliO/FliZ
LGGEKLNRFYAIIFAALFLGAGLFYNNPGMLYAQTQEGDAPSESAASEPSPESLIIFNAEGDGEVAAPETLSGFTALRMVLVLVFTAAAVYGVVFFFKRLSKPSAPENPYLKVLARAPIGGGGAVAVVSVGTRAWLVGAGERGAALIAEIEDQEVVDAMLLDNSRNTAGSLKSMNFAALMRRFGGGREEKRLEAGDLRKRRERLDKL